MKKTSGVKVTQASKVVTFNTKSYERNGISEDEVWEIKEAFDLFDIEGKGAIDTKQLKTAMTSQGFQTSNQTLYQIISQLQSDGVKAIGFDEFFSIMTARASDKDTRENTKKVFAIFDDERTGFISVKNLRKITKELGETIDQAELQEMIDRADLDNDGLVSEEEFYQIISKKAKAR